MKQLFQIDLGSDLKKIRLDSYLFNQLKEKFSRSMIQKMIKEKKINIYFDNQEINQNKIKPSLLLKKGMIIELSLEEQEFKKNQKITPKFFPLKILYEDDVLAIIHKPPGISVHPGNHQEKEEITILHAILYHWNHLYENIKIDNEFPNLQRPGLVHRLDKMTEGLLIIAKNISTQWKFSRMFQSREIYKEYLAWLQGTPPEEKGIIDLPLMRHPKERNKMHVNPAGRRAITEYEILKTITSNHYRKYSKVKINLITGRTHQIRAHFHHLKTPVVGDSLYYHVDPIVEKYGLLLLAKKIRFLHPIKNQNIEFEIQEPERFQEFEKKCKNY